ncbi:anti-sigma factor [Pedobacter sp. Leaf250]|uniref:anti-sigma factor family protein n=1 Tax=Pedobacter sp. Leaf250 TaxID=2876559 RepID=UPI001E3111C2|nr:zf-HC2 domain-containing protein [Pedobacter sp. Leaf250]
MNTIEQQLWDYIDGNLDATEARAIEEKINSDVEIKLQYEELMNLNLAFGKIELDEPSMSFTRNVMESVALQPAPVALKTKLNTNIIYGIGGFFIISLLALFGYAIFNIDFKAVDFDLKLNADFNLDKYITPTMLYSFLFADLVIGLVFLDYLLRKKLMHK